MITIFCVRTFWKLVTSVSDPFHFDTDPVPMVTNPYPDRLRGNFSSVNLVFTCYVKFITVFRIHLILIRIRIRGFGSDGYGSGSEVTLTKWILFSLLNVLRGYNLLTIYSEMYQKKKYLTKKMKILKVSIFFHHVFTDNFDFFMAWFWIVSGATRIRIRII